MPIATKLRALLEQNGIAYQLVPHAPAGTSSGKAQAAHVPGANLAKGVVIENSDHCTMVVLPATEQIHLGELRRELGDTYGLATEDEVEHIFADCDRGAVPPFGQAYGLDVLVDESLLERDRIYAESGDRATLLAISGDDFRRLMHGARHGHYGHPA
ncbi:MAG TPA: YbaK/EbsC family protein [Pseudomonadales bacterium]